MFNHTLSPEWKPAAMQREPHSPAASTTEFTIARSFGPRQVQFSYAGPITSLGIKTLAEYVNTALALYQPEEVAVQLRSPGGLMPALEYWEYCKQGWQAQGQVIATQADTECASAAALMVTLGTVGRRSAHPLSRLLFHNPRLVSRDITLLEQDAEEVALALKESRNRMHALLSQHLLGSLGELSFARSLHIRAAWLVEQEHSREYRALQALHRPAHAQAELPEWLDAWAQARPDSQDEAQALITDWTAQIESLFRKEQFIDLQTAWVLLLIDASDLLPPLIETQSSASHADGPGLLLRETAARRSGDSSAKPGSTATP